MPSGSQGAAPASTHFRPAFTDPATSFSRSDDLVRQTDQFFDWIDYSFHLPLTMAHLEPQGSEPPWRRAGLTFLAAKDTAPCVQWPWNENQIDLFAPKRS